MTGPNSILHRDHEMLDAVKSMFTEESYRLMLLQQHMDDADNIGSIKYVIFSTDLGKCLFSVNTEPAFCLAVLLMPDTNPAYMLAGIDELMDNIASTLEFTP